MVATPPRVASRMARTPGTAPSRPAIIVVHRRRVRGQVGLDVELAAGQHDRHAVVADRPGHDDRVTGAGGGDTEGQIVLDHPHPGRIDVAAVRLAPLDHLGVAGDDLHPGRRRGGGHGRHDRGQVGDGEAFLQHEAGRQVQRGGAGHRQVVDGPVHGQVADVAAGEEQRRNDVGVGGQRQPRIADPQLRGVLQRLEQRVAERVEEHRLDQGLGGLAAGPVRHGDPLFPDPRAAAPGPVDPVQHLLLAVGRAAGPPARPRLPGRPVLGAPVRGRPVLGGRALGRRVLLVLAQGLVHPAGPPLAHGRVSSTSTTRRRLMRP